MDMGNAWKDHWLSGKKEGRKEGVTQGIEALILDNLEEGKNEETIIGKLERRFGLNGPEAKEYFDRFSKTAV